MNVKIIERQFAEDLEGDVNKWLSENSQNINITHVTQSHTKFMTCISIWCLRKTKFDMAKGKL